MTILMVLVGVFIDQVGVELNTAEQQCLWQLAEVLLALHPAALSTDSACRCSLNEHHVQGVQVRIGFSLNEHHVQGVWVRDGFRRNDHYVEGVQARNELSLK